MSRYLCEWAWLGGERAEPDVLIETGGGQITVVAAAAPGAAATRLRGLTVPGLANAHSHAFHRALRGRAQTRGDFWSWRGRMYDVAGRLTPDSYFALARAAYAEMALAGITTVGEFHYLHHGPGGVPYADPHAMSAALAAAAAEAGVHLVLLDTCYLTADIDGSPLSGPQLRFGDGSVDAWQARVAGTGHGAAIHSVRAVPADAMAVVAEYARSAGVPLHAHVSEQPRENDAALARTGCTPTELLDRAGALGAATTLVHATHCTDGDLARIGAAGSRVCVCPTTERDLADGIGPTAALAAAGVPLSLGSDSHAVVDLLEEARAVELDERLASGRRGTWSAPALLAAATTGGLAALGRPAGGLAAGMPADFVTIDLDSVRTAGGADPLATAVFAATAADVRTVVAGGHVVADHGQHARIDVARELATAIAAVLS